MIFSPIPRFFGVPLVWQSFAAKSLQGISELDISNWICGTT
jgi:hypothetical protein